MGVHIGLILDPSQMFLLKLRKASYHINLGVVEE